MRFSNIHMSSPSLPMFPQWLERALGVKRALGILLLYVVIRGHVTSPFSAWPAQRIWPANETMSYDRESATCVCVLEYTHFNTSVVQFLVIWITDLLLVLWRITRNTIRQACIW